MSDDAFIAVFAAQILAFALALVGLAAGAYLAWTHAPPVGGEWWPYIRVGAVIVAAVIGAKVGALVGYLTAVIVGIIVAVFWAVVP